MLQPHTHSATALQELPGGGMESLAWGKTSPHVLWDTALLPITIPSFSTCYQPWPVPSSCWRVKHRSATAQLHCLRRETLKQINFGQIEPSTGHW